MDLRQSYLGGLDSLERDLGMNKKNHFPKVLFLTYHYSHTYELEYSLYVMILAYELAYSSYAMKLAYMTYCLIIQINHMIRIRAKLRWRFIVPSGFFHVLCLSIRRVGVPEGYG